MPEGICTVESSASSPSSVEELIGSPITGRTVLAASAPARCAALPAAAISTPKPFFSACCAKSAASAGVLCAEMILISKGMPSSFSVSAALLTLPRSLSLPITMAAFFMATSCFTNIVPCCRCYYTRFQRIDQQYSCKSRGFIVPAPNDELEPFRAFSWDAIHLRHGMQCFRAFFVILSAAVIQIFEKRVSARRVNFPCRAAFAPFDFHEH